MKMGAMDMLIDICGDEEQKKGIEFPLCKCLLILMKVNGCAQNDLLTDMYISHSSIRLRKMENGMDSVYWRVFSGISNEKETGQKEYKMKVVQVVLPL